MVEDTKKYPDIKLQMIPYMNSQESAREILKNLGTNIDVVAGIFDETMLKLRQCKGLELSRQRIFLTFTVWRYSTSAKTATIF